MDGPDPVSPTSDTSWPEVHFHTECDLHTAYTTDGVLPKDFNWRPFALRGYPGTCRRVPLPAREMPAALQAAAQKASLFLTALATDEAATRAAEHAVERIGAPAGVPGGSTADDRNEANQ